MCSVFPKLLNCLFIQVPLPTEVVVVETQVVTPKIARVYQTNLHLYIGEVREYEDVYREQSEANPGQHVCFSSLGIKPVLVMEHWEDGGSDGHVEPYLIGYRFVTLPTKYDKKRVDEYRKREFHLTPFVYESSWFYGDDWKQDIR